MTAAVPAMGLRRLARPAPRLRAEQKSFGHQSFATEPQGDRAFVTLLSLNFMLLAFFIVLGAAASVDKSRARSVAQNVRIAFSGSEQPAKPRAALLTARQALQAGVSDAFADLLPAQPRFYVDNSDRIDVDVPESVLASSDDIEGVYDNIARLLQMAPAGFRYELLITGGGETSASGKATYAFAGSLVDRGVAPQDILIGASPDNADRLRLSFLVFEGELVDDGEPWTTGILAQPPRRAPLVVPPTIEQAPADQPVGADAP